jgi:hypothetical protein
LIGPLKNMLDESEYLQIWPPLLKIETSTFDTFSETTGPNIIIKLG